MQQGPYWHYSISSGDFIDPDKRFVYLGDASPSKSGYRRAIAKDMITGEVFESSFVSLRTGKAKTPSEKQRNYQTAANKRARYHEGDLIGKYGNILIVDLDPEKYPPKVRKDGKTDRCGLFRNLETGEEFVATLNHAVSKSSEKICSLGEKHLSEVFAELHIACEPQKTYKGLSGFSGGKPMSFDFYLPNENVLVEYDGVQHLLSHHDEKMFSHSSGQDRFVYYARDIIKEAWCCAHGIPLVRLANIPLYKLCHETVCEYIECAKIRAEKGDYISFFPEGAQNEYESVAVVMSNLDARYQYEFYRSMRDTFIDYRRPLDVPLGEDPKLEKALPHGSTPPVLFGTPEPRTFYKRKRLPVVIGDIIGGNGVKYISDFDDQGNKITPSGKKRHALFECACGNHFISSFASVRGSKSNNYEGKVCSECTKSRRAHKFNEVKQHRLPRPVKQYKAGEYVDPENKFRFVEENRCNTRNRSMVVEDPEGNQFTFSLPYLLSGRAKIQAERDAARNQRYQRKICKGDVIGIDRCLVAQHDVEYHTYDDYGKIPIKVYNSKTGRTYEIKLSTALRSHTTGTRGIAVHKSGEVVGKAGVVFLRWCDEQGNAIDIEDAVGIVSEYAHFRCSCREKTEFIAEWRRVRDGEKQCPACMQRRKEEGCRKNGHAHKITFLKDEPVDPNGKYVYVGEDDDAHTNKRKIIIKSIETGEEFSYPLDKVRQGNIMPPSQAKANRRLGHDANQKYKVGDIITNSKGSYCIIGELDAQINSQGNPLRRFVFQNLLTGYLFDSVMQPVKSGLVTGARSKKTRSDYPEALLLSEDQVKAASKTNQMPSRKKKSDMEILDDIGADLVQEMLADRSSTQIAQELGIAFQSVCSFVKKHGLHNPHSNAARKIDIASMPLDEIKRRLDSGQSMTSIGKELGYTYVQMKKALDHIRTDQH